MKKNNYIIINPIKVFKRYLKEHGLYSYYKRTTGITKETLKNIQPHDYFSTSLIKKANKSYWQETVKFKHNNGIWLKYLTYECAKDVYIEKFIIFLKKRGIYNLYISCFAPYYTNITLTKTEPKFKYSPCFEITQWKDLYPQNFISSSFDWDNTIKPRAFWETTNNAWLAEIEVIKRKIKYIIT